MVDFSMATGLSSLQNSVGNFVNNWNQGQQQNLAQQQQNWKLSQLQGLGDSLSSGDYAGAISKAAASGDVSLIPSLLSLKQQADQLKSWNGTPSAGASLSGLAPNAGAGAGSTPAPQPGTPAASGPQVISTPTGPLDLNAAKSSIAGIESVGSGGYGATGPVQPNGDKAYGKYQVMGKNIPAWTQQVLGQAMTPEQFLASPQAQEKTFETLFGQAAQKWGHAGAANWWFTGSPNPSAGAADSNGTTAGGYVDRFMRGYVQARGSSPQQQASAAPVAPLQGNGGMQSPTQPQPAQAVGGAPMAPAQLAGAPYQAGPAAGAPAQPSTARIGLNGQPVGPNPTAGIPAPPIQVASASPSVPRPDTLPPPSAQQGGAAVAPQAAQPSTSAPRAIRVLNPDTGQYYPGAFTRDQTSTSEDDTSRPSPQEWDASAKTLGPAGGAPQPGAPTAPGQPQPQQPNSDSSSTPDAAAGQDRALGIARAAGFPQWFVSALAATKPGSPERAGIMQKAAGLAASTQAAAQLKPTFDAMQDAEKQVSGLPSDYASYRLSQSDPAYAAFLSKDKVPQGQQNLQYAEKNWQALGLPDPSLVGQPTPQGQAATQFWQQASAKGLGLSPTPLVTVDQRGQTDMQKHAVDAMAAGYQGITGGTGGIQRLNALNRMQGNLNNGIIEGWGPAQSAAQATAAVLAKLGVGDPTKLANTQEFISDGLQEVMAAAKSTFPQRITNADLNILKQSNAADPALVKQALQHVIDSLRETTVQGVEQHNASIERYAKAFPNEADQARGLYSVDAGKLPAATLPTVNDANGNQVPYARSQAEYDSLPANSPYTDDGQHIRMKGAPDQAGGGNR